MGESESHPACLARLQESLRNIVSNHGWSVLPSGQSSSCSSSGDHHQGRSTATAALKTQDNEPPWGTHCSSEAGKCEDELFSRRVLDSFSERLSVNGCASSQDKQMVSAVERILVIKSVPQSEEPGALLLGFTLSLSMRALLKHSRQSEKKMSHAIRWFIWICFVPAALLLEK